MGSENHEVLASLQQAVKEKVGSLNYARHLYFGNRTYKIEIFVLFIITTAFRLNAPILLSSTLLPRLRDVDKIVPTPQFFILIANFIKAFI